MAKKSVLLSNGSRLDVRVLRSIPDDRYAEIEVLYRHKRHFLGQFEDFRLRGARGRIDGLEWRTYVGLVDKRIIAGICTWEHGGYGILGHVYTYPEFRRLGVARATITSSISADI